jgi:hypothetical protein
MSVKRNILLRRSSNKTETAQFETMPTLKIVGMFSRTCENIVLFQYVRDLGEINKQFKQQPWTDGSKKWYNDYNVCTHLDKVILQR